jgi:hypothetical protein
MAAPRAMRAMPNKQWGGLRQFKLRGTEKVGNGVWDARDRLQPDPAGQPAPTASYRGCMNRQLPRGVPKQKRSESPTEAKRLKSSVLSR